MHYNNNMEPEKNTDEEFMKELFLNENSGKIYPTIEETKLILKNNPTFISTLIAIALVNDIKLERAISYITCLFYNGLIDTNSLYYFIRKIKGNKGKL